MKFFKHNSLLVSSVILAIIYDLYSLHNLIYLNSLSVDAQCAYYENYPYIYHNNFASIIGWGFFILLILGVSTLFKIPLENKSKGMWSIFIISSAIIFYVLIIMHAGICVH